MTESRFYKLPVEIAARKDLQDRRALAMNAEMKTTSEPFLVNAAEAARLCGISRSLWWSMHSAGAVPLPIKLSHRTLWRAEELRRWTESGCPSRAKWQGGSGQC